MVLDLMHIENDLSTANGPMFLANSLEPDQEDFEPTGYVCCMSIELNTQRHEVDVLLTEIEGPDFGLVRSDRQLPSTDELFTTNQVQLMSVSMPNDDREHVIGHGYSPEYLLILFGFASAFIAWSMGVCTKDDYCAGLDELDRQVLLDFITKNLKSLEAEVCACGVRSRQMLAEIAEVSG